jgi:hypothetical protein
MVFRNAQGTLKGENRDEAFDALKPHFKQTSGMGCKRENRDEAFDAIKSPK